MSSTVAEVLLRVRDEASKSLGEVGEAASEADQDVKRLQAALDGAQRDMKVAGDAADHVGRSAGVAGSSAMKLAGALSLVSPAAGDVARNAGDLADVVEVAATAAGALGVSLGTLAAVALPLGLVIGGLVYAHNQATEAAEKHKEAVEALSAAQKAAFDPAVALAGAVGDLEGQAAVLSGSLDELTVRQAKEAQQLQVLAREAQATATEELRAAEAAFAHVQTYAETSKEYREANSALQAARERLDRVVESTNTLNALLPQVQAGERAKAEATQAAAQADRQAAEDARHSADERRNAAEAAAEEKARLDELQKALDAEAAVRFARETDAAAEALRAFDAALGKIDLTDQIDDTAALASAQAGLALELSRGAISADQYDAAMARLDAVRSAPAHGSESTTAAAGSIASTAGAWANGPTSGMAAMGPWGALIGMLVDIVSDLGGTMDKFTQSHKQMWEGIENIPQTLMDKLPEAIEQGLLETDAFVGFFEGFADHLDEILTGIMRSAAKVLTGITENLLSKLPAALNEFLVVLVNPMTWIKAAWEFITGVVDGLKESWGNVKDGGGVVNFLTGGWSKIIGSFDVGTKYVPQDGLAFVHEGERIYRPDQGAPAGAGVQVQVNATAITADGARELARELGRYLGPGGIGLTLEPS